MANDLATLRETDLANVRATSIGFIFQTFNLIPTLSAQENVETALAPLRVTGADRRTRAAQALAGVGLAERLNHLPSELPGGQQQRVAIARVRNPARRLSGPRLRQRRSGLAGRFQPATGVLVPGRDQVTAGARTGPGMSPPAGAGRHRHRACA